MLKMIFTALSLTACASLTGCAVGGDMELGLSRLVGRNVKDVVSVLGYPTSQVQVAGDTVYTWDTQVQPLFTSQAPLPCQVRVVTADNTIKTWSYSGTMNGCRPTASALRTWADQHRS